MITTEEIAENFSAAAKSYDQLAKPQSDVANMLSRMVCSESTTYDRLLDIGSGTGFLTHILRERLPATRISALDISKAMLSILQTKQANQDYLDCVMADGTSLPFSGAKFDCIASSSAFHWFEDMSSAFHESYRVLQDNGHFFLATYGKMMFQELYQSFPQEISGRAREYATNDEISSLLTESGFREICITDEIKTVNYCDAQTFLRSIKKTGVNISSSNSRFSRGHVNSIIDTLDKRFQTCDGVDITWHMQFCHARKSE